MPFDIPDYGPPHKSDDKPLNNKERLIISLCFFVASGLSIALSAVSNDKAKDFALSELKKEGISVQTPEDFKKYEKKIDSLESIYNFK